MRLTVVFWLGVVALACGSLAEEAEDAAVVKEDASEEAVVTIGADNITELVTNSDKAWLLEFYAPWCGHCKSLAPAYEEAAQKLKESHPNIGLAKIDATVESSLASDYEVQGYPTLKIVKEGKSYDYESGRDVDSIVSTMTEVSSPEWKPPQSPVLELTDENFDEITSNEKLLLVAFTAPWCGHCKRLKPEFKQAAQQLKRQKAVAKLANVDATQYPDLAQKFQVTGYPTMKVFRKGDVSDYQGQREAQGIVEEMTMLEQPAAYLFKTFEEMLENIERDQASIVAFLDPENKDGLRIMNEACESYRRSFPCSYVTSDSIRTKIKAEPNSVVLFQAKQFVSKWEPARFSMKLASDTKPQAVIDFIDSNATPIVGFRESDSPLNYDGRPLVVLYYNGNYSPELRAETSFWREKLVAAVQSNFGDKVNKEIWFAMAFEESWVDALADFGRADYEEDFTVVIYDEEGQYLMEEDFDIDTFIEYIEKYFAGELEFFYKSEPIPTKDDGHVKIVVGKNFADIVDNADQDVLIEFYAPWCGHCKSFAPTYRKLAKKLRKVEGLTIAKIDATANHFPHKYMVLQRGSDFSSIFSSHLNRYPSLFFAPKDNKENPIVYDGDRSIDDILKFLRKNASVKVPKFKKKAKAKDEL